MHHIPKRKKESTLKKTIKYSLALFFIVTFALYSYFYGSIFYLFLSVFLVLLVLVIILSKLFVNYFTGTGYAVFAALSDLTFIFIAIPILVIMAVYLPYSILIFFFGVDRLLIIRAIITPIILMQLAAVSFVIRKKLNDMEMSLFEYIKYLVDFKRRIREAELQREKSHKMQTFFDNLHLIERNILRQKNQDPTPFTEFDWKERLDEIFLVDKDSIKKHKKEENEKK